MKRLNIDEENAKADREKKLALWCVVAMLILVCIDYTKLGIVIGLLGFSIDFCRPLSDKEMRDR